MPVTHKVEVAALAVTEWRPAAQMEAPEIDIGVAVMMLVQLTDCHGSASNTLEKEFIVVTLTGLMINL